MDRDAMAAAWVGVAANRAADVLTAPNIMLVSHRSCAHAAGHRRLKIKTVRITDSFLTLLRSGMEPDVDIFLPLNESGVRKFRFLDQIQRELRQRGIRGSGQFFFRSEEHTSE